MKKLKLTSPLGGRASMGESATVAADVAWLRAYGAALGRALTVPGLEQCSKAQRQVDLAFQPTGKARAVRAELYRSIGLDC